MRYTLQTNYKKCTLLVPVKATRLCTVYVEVYDVQHSVYLSKRFLTLSPGEERRIYVRMPYTGKSILVSVYEDNNRADAKPVNFTLNAKDIRLLALPARIRVNELKSARIKEWVQFATQFCFNASILPCYDDRYYTSRYGNFKIHYMEKIMEDGRENITPMRVNQKTKIEEISKNKILPMTFPGRFCCDGHEVGHLELNKNEDDEEEADLQSLSIYLGLGFDPEDAKEFYREVFFQEALKDDPEIQERWNLINKFIDDFESFQLDHLVRI